MDRLNILWFLVELDHKQEELWKILKTLLNPVIPQWIKWYDIKLLKLTFYYK